MKDRQGSGGRKPAPENSPITNHLFTYSAGDSQTDAAKKANRRLYAGFLLVFLIGAAIFLAILFTVKAPNIKFDNEDVLPISNVWEIRVGDNLTSAALPIHIDASKGQTVTYSTVLTGDGKTRNSLLMRGQHQYVKVWLDGELLEEFGYGQSSVIGEAPYAGWILTRLPEDWEGKTLTVEQTAYYDSYAGILSEAYIGTKNALVFMVLHRCLLPLVCNLTIMAIGILLLGVSLFFRYSHMVRRIRCLSVFALITSLWLLLESGGYQLAFGRAPLISNLIFLLFGMMPVACIRFLLTYDGFFESRYFRGLYGLSVGVFLIQQFLQFAHILDYIESIFLVHLVIVLCIVGILGRYLGALLRRRKSNDRSVSIACAVFSGFGLIDIARFYFVSPSENSVLFSQIGLFFFFLILSFYAAESFVDDRENSLRQEFFEHMAFTDLLTGIPNRNAFEQELDRYRRDPDLGQPTILVTDLNNLKKINDNFGHSQGDLAIATVARSLTEVFSDSALVYRIGGDEFCVIAPKLEDTATQQKCALLKKQLEKDASARKLPLSVAIGWHRKQVEEIDQTFNMADAAMYRDKLLTKRE